MTTKPTPAALTWRGVTARRMARHALTEPATGLDPAGIAGVLCGAHPRLLPYFDPYLVAGQPRERLYPGAAAIRALTPAGQAGNYPVLLVDGVVGGCGTSGAPVASSPSPSSRCAS